MNVRLVCCDKGGVLFAEGPLKNHLVCGDKEFRLIHHPFSIYPFYLSGKIGELFIVELVFSKVFIQISDLIQQFVSIKNHRLNPYALVLPIRYHV